MEKIKNVDINYVTDGTGTDVVLIHGWGQNIEMMQPIGDALKENFRVTYIDLPGHGGSQEPNFAWDVPDFAQAIHELFDKLGITNPIIIGHSFGGKIGLLYASKYEVAKLILLASPFKKEIQKLSLKTKMLKLAKKVPVVNKLEDWAKKRIGSDDYRNASPLMRQILVNTVNLDITEEVKKIKAPTLIIWGTEDEAVSIERAYELETLIDDSGVVIYNGATHYAYLERLSQVNRVIRTFLMEER